ncbi:MAG TPA: alpha/beta hydrolase [Chitinophagaceae bacterium]|nr:alpha/beta hydrolase [Chitinophagaceae bacterium]
MTKALRYLFFILVISGCKDQEKKPVSLSGFITVADSKLYYESTGTGEAILLLHGGFMNSRMWDEQVKEFSKKYCVITCDLRGHGLTVDGDSSYFMYEAIRMLLDTLGEKKVNIAGLSLGAMIATDFAIEYPQYVNRLILITPGLNSLDTTFAQDSTITKYSNLMGDAVTKQKDTMLAAEYFIRSWFDGPYRSPEQTDTAARKKALAMATETMKTHKFLHWTRLAEPPAIQRLKKITAPTLIIIAEKDNYRISKNAEALKNGIANSKIVTIRNAAHLVSLEKPEEFNKTFLEFIKK